MIDQDRFDRVNAVLYKNRRGNKEPKTYARKNTHVFAGLLFCGYCNALMQATLDRPRAGGYRPSIYACSTKRRFDTCPNKFISDIVVGPFVMNYVANIIKASKNFGRTTSVEAFQKKLLRGEMFKAVKGIEATGLQEMYDMLRDGVVGKQVFRTPEQDEADGLPTERELLLSERRKNERALSRLKTVLLYSDDDISEKDFILERRAILEKIDAIDARLEELDVHANRGFAMSDDEFMDKASYFILEQQLTTKRYISFTTFIQAIDPRIVKNFMQTIIQKIVVKDGRIMSILFSNGIEHKFLYD